MMKKDYNDYNKQITTRDNGTVQEGKLNSTINVNNGAHTLVTKN